MGGEELFERVRSTIIDVLDLDDGAKIETTTTADDIDGWDSLQHVRILTTLEKRFNFRFSDEEVQSLTDVGALVSVVSQRVGSQS